VASLLRRNHENGDPWVDFEAAHRTWITHLEIGRSFGARQPPGSYLEIRYEDFVGDDVVGAKELCAFLDLELPPAVEEFCTAPRRLNWGCGNSGEPGWINSDIKEGPGVDISCDIRDGLPIESDSLDYIVSVHALPMITYGDLVPVLEELRRMLKPGGVLRLCVPDADKGIHAYLSGDRAYCAVSDEDAATLG